MLRRIKGVTLRDKVKSVGMRKELGVTNTQKKIRRYETKLVWTHAAEWKKNNEVRAVVDIRVPGKRPRGRPRRRWMDCVQINMQALRITPEDDLDRTFWKSRIRAADPT